MLYMNEISQFDMYPVGESDKRISFMVNNGYYDASFFDTNVNVANTVVHTHNDSDVGYSLLDRMYYSKSDKMEETTFPIQFRLTGYNDRKIKDLVNYKSKELMLEMTINGVTWFMQVKAGNQSTIVKRNVVWKTYDVEFKQQSRPYTISQFSSAASGQELNKGGYNLPTGYNSDDTVYSSLGLNMDQIDATIRNTDGHFVYFKFEGLALKNTITITVNNQEVKLINVSTGTKVEYSNIPSDTYIKQQGVNTISLLDPANPTNFLFNTKDVETIRLRVDGLEQATLTVFKVGYIL